MTPWTRTVMLFSSEKRARESTAAGGALFALGTEWGNALCAGDATGLAVVWRQD